METLVQQNTLLSNVSKGQIEDDTKNQKSIARKQDPETNIKGMKKQVMTF